MSYWQEPDGTWKCRIYSGGTARSPRVQKTLGKISAKDAKRKYTELVARAHARAGRYYLRATLLDCAESWAELAAPHLSKGWAATAAMVLEERLVPFFGSRPADELQSSDVERYRLARLREGAAPATVNREVAILMRVLALGFAHGLIDRHPFPKGAVEKLRESKGRLVYFEEDEWRRFRAAFDDPEAWERVRCELREEAQARRKTPGPGGAPLPDSDVSHEYRARLRQTMPVFEALLLTASRLSEVLRIRWADVDLQTGTVRIFQGKTWRPKILPLRPALRALFESMPKGFPASPVFQRPSGGEWERDKVYDAFVLARRLAGLREELVIHSLRHTAGSWMAIAGTPLKEIQEMLGHADARTTQKYLHLRPTHLSAAADVIERASGLVPFAPVREKRGHGIATKSRGAGGTGAAKS